MRLSSLSPWLIDITYLASHPELVGSRYELSPGIGIGRPTIARVCFGRARSAGSLKGGFSLRRLGVNILWTGLAI